jgi:hypothetical protein
MHVAQHDSLAGKLLQKHAVLSPVGASLLAIVRMKGCLFSGAIRLQASSYKYKMPFPL